jgi:carbohydrate diacid regulator
MNRLFDGFVNNIREITGYDFGVADDTGAILACTDIRAFEDIEQIIDNFLDSEDIWLTNNGVTYHKVIIRDRPEFILFMTDEGDRTENYLEIASISAYNIKLYYEEKYDKNSFIKQIILDNILPGDISIRAKELHIATRALRVALIIRLEKDQEIYSHEIIQNLFPDRLKDFVVVIDDESTALIKELGDDDDARKIDQIAKNIIDTLNTESMLKAKIGIGTPVESLSEIGRSFKEAQTALLVGGIFENEKSVINYNSLGLGRLIYQLPETLCKLFLDEVFTKGAYESLDNETILTIQKFFENNLNVSETSRLLYVHRNTLVYRLDKIQKITGLDLRNFDDAIIFKVSMLVKKYLDKGERVL